MAKKTWEKMGEIKLVSLGMKNKISKYKWNYLCVKNESVKRFKSGGSLKLSLYLWVIFIMNIISIFYIK